MAGDKIPYPSRSIEYQRAWRAKNRERLRQYSREYQKKYLADPVKRAKRREQDRTNRKKPARMARRRRRREERRVKLAGRQKPNKCEVCGCDGRISFDHCHASGTFRGWICEGCNLIIGLAKDNPELLRKLAEYLDAHRAANAQHDFIAALEIEQALER